MRYREDDLVTGAWLRGNRGPFTVSWKAGIAGAEGRDGKPNGAVRFSGTGMLRYTIRNSPIRNARSPLGLPREPVDRSALFSAWARSMDDPLRVYVKDDLLQVGIEGGGNAGLTGEPIPFGEWTHVAVVKNGIDLTLYLNGEEAAGQGAATLDRTAAVNVALGANPNYSGDEYFTGRLAEFALYGRAMSAEEVRQVFSGGLKLE